MIDDDLTPDEARRRLADYDALIAQLEDSRDGPPGAGLRLAAATLAGRRDDLARRLRSRETDTP